jgi:kumamolisin
LGRNANIAAPKKQRFLPPLLYQNGANGKPREFACHNITAGQNASYPDPGVGPQARTGYDAVTGWGLPDGSQLLKSL